MCTVSFKAKPETIYNPDGTPAWVWIKVPDIKRIHCDIAAFRADRRFSGFANSDMFGGLVKRALKNAGIGSHIRLDQLPACVNVQPGAFLSVVTITL